MKKRFLSALLCLCMVVCLLPTTAFATEMAATVKNVNLGCTGIKQGKDKSGSKIYFASSGSPIEWHVKQDGQAHAADPCGG